MKLKNICIKCKKNKTCKTPCAFVERMKEAAKGVCLDCVHYDTCNTPCFLAEAFIDENVKSIFEKKNESGHDKILIVYTPNNRKFQNFTSLERTDKEGTNYNPIDDTTMEDVENFWNGLAYNGNSIFFCVFVDRFFNKMSFADMAIKYNTKESNIIGYYMQAKTDIYNFLDAWNNEKRLLGFKKQAKSSLKKMESIPKRVKAFLLHYCFDFTYDEIGEMIDSKRISVGDYVRLVKKDVKAGVNIIKFDEDLNPVPINHMDKSRDRQEKTQGALCN